jgi:hypothetical protein
VSGEQYGVVVHGVQLDTDQPQATVIRSDDGWTWQEVCTTDPETATEIAEALHQVALRRSDTYGEAIAAVMVDAIERQEFDRATYLAAKWRGQQ